MKCMALCTARQWVKNTPVMNVYDWNSFCDMSHQMDNMYRREIIKFRYRISTQNSLRSSWNFCTAETDNPIMVKIKTLSQPSRSQFLSPILNGNQC